MALTTRDVLRKVLDSSESEYSDSDDEEFSSLNSDSGNFFNFTVLLNVRKICK